MQVNQDWAESQVLELLNILFASFSPEQAVTGLQKAKLTLFIFQLGSLTDLTRNWL